MQPKGHHRRGYLPHRDYGGALQAVTFREADSLPAQVIVEWKRELQPFTDSAEEEKRTEAGRELLRRIARYEDSGQGRCLLRKDGYARILQGILIEGHGSNYELLAWCIMPNHLHVLIRQGKHAALGDIVRSWKGRSSRLINLAAKRRGALWAKDYFDRAIRDQEHFHRAVAYIHRNPVKAGLVEDSSDWPFSSKGVNWPSPSS